MQGIYEVYAGPHDSNSLVLDKSAGSYEYTEYTKASKNKYFAPKGELSPTIESVYDCSVDTHHKYHLCTAVYSYNKPFEGIGLVVDGYGQCASEKIYSIKKGKIETIYSDKVGISIGNLWNILGIAYFGYPMFESHGKAGTMMALASRGEVNNAVLLELIDAYKRDIFEFLQAPNEIDEFEYIVDVERVKGFFGEASQADICATLQEFTNKTILRKVEPHVNTGDTLMFAGGVAHNVVLIKYLEDELGIDIFTGFAQGDEGISLGKYFYDKYIVRQEEYSPKGFRQPYSNNAKDFELPYVDIGLSLSVDGVTAIYNSSPEIGNRALGRRSFIADPSFPNIKQKLDALKRREGFRPYGVMVLAEECELWFDKKLVSPYMNKIVTPSDKFKNLFTSLVHGDGTIRVQTVTKDLYPEMYRLLTYVGVVFGHSVLINTSLNISTPMLYKEDKALVKLMVDEMVIGSCYIDGVGYERV